MAKGKKENLQAKDTASGSKRKSMLFTLLTFFLVILIVGGILGGGFYLIVHSNINGMGEKYRKNIQNVPILRLALPKAPDPLDPKYLTNKEIKDKYIEFKALNEELNKLLAEAEKKTADLQKYKDEYDNYKAENDRTAQALKERTALLDDEQVKYDALKKEVDLLIANGDKAGFKEYFEKVSPDMAKEVYTSVVKQQQTDESIKKFAQVYEVMDPAAAAAIFEEMGNDKIDMLAETIKSMKKEKSAEIMAAMSPEFASKLTEKLDELYRNIK